MDWLLDPQVWIAFLTLTVLEIVLGIDNVVFIAILVDKLPTAQQGKARLIGLLLAMLMRIALLFSLSWILGLTAPLFTIWQTVSGRDLILLLGGLFLIAKSTYEIHHKLEGEEGHASARVAGLTGQRAGADHSPGHRVFPRFGHHRGRHDEPTGHHDHSGDCGGAVHDGICRSHQCLCQPPSDGENFSPEFLTADRYDAHHRRVASAHLQGLHLLCHGLFGASWKCSICACAGSRACRCTCTSRTLRKGRSSIRNHSYKRICQGENMDITRAAVVDYIMNLFGRRGSADYGGERVTQLAHALQTAWQAEQQGSSRALIVAALLHDIGHLLHDRRRAMQGAALTIVMRRWGHAGWARILGRKWRCLSSCTWPPNAICAPQRRPTCHLVSRLGTQSGVARWPLHQRAGTTLCRQTLCPGRHSLATLGRAGQGVWFADTDAGAFSSASRSSIARAPHCPGRRI